MMMILKDNLARIRENHERALREAKETLQKLPEEIQRDILLEKEKVAEEQRRDRSVFRKLPPVYLMPLIGPVDQEPTDAAVRNKRAKIKEAQSQRLFRFPFFSVIVDVAIYDLRLNPVVFNLHAWVRISHTRMMCSPPGFTLIYSRRTAVRQRTYLHRTSFQGREKRDSRAVDRP
ncbi:hypothetical protein CB1_001058006 [Camelus ferus]|nr:hypothetical protein CB1_001058006 [Camelus ferus]